MCVLVYTLPQLCGHTHLQNVAECDLAAAERSRGRGPMVIATTSTPPTEPRFLFDTAREAPAAVERVRAYPCRKRRAVRPAPVMCEGCMLAERTRRKKEKEKEEEKEGLEAKRKRDVQERVKNEEQEQEQEQEDVVAAFLAVPRALAGSGSAGSSLALMTGSNSVNALSDAGTSGASTPRSLWKLAHPSEIV